MSLPQRLPRRVEPEWLDALPAADPRAVRSRRDLRRVNALMLNAGIMARAIVAHWSGDAAPRTILDIGSGDGTFMLAVARRLAPRWRDVTVRLLDRQDIVSAETRAAFARLQWRAEPVTADVFDFLMRDGARADIITANLVLHHFGPAELPVLLGHVTRHTRLFAACETWRAAHALALSCMLWAIGCNDVTCHDAVASVRAGFRGRELSALWPHGAGWDLQEGSAFAFTHRFVASRR